MNPSRAVLLTLLVILSFTQKARGEDTYSIGGIVSDLAGPGLVLQNNGSDDLAISADGSFTFPTALNDGSTYAVTVLTQPIGPKQTCSVLESSGTLDGTDITNVVVNCVVLPELIFTDSFEGNVAITVFSASPPVITEGQSTTLSWVTENADSCTPSGGTGGWSDLSIATNDLVNGSTIITATTEGAIQFALTCKDVHGVSTTSNVTVTVEPEAVTCPIPNLSGSTVDWDDQWGTAFPGPTYRTVTIALPRYGYRAIKFNTGQVDDDGRVLGIENTNTTGIVFGTISKCPGDFADELPMDCKYKWGLGGSIDWTTKLSSYSCELDEDTTYYLNLTFTNGDDPEETTCISNLCNATMQHRNY